MNPPADPRRHDLDALRAFAMLSGIALHAALSFMPMFWPVQDVRQSNFFGVFFSAIHGFRMPVFFVMSGFFTAMLWRQRGLKSVLGHRTRRVLLPLLLGLVTIVPAVNWVVVRAIESGSQQTMQAPVATDEDVNQLDPESGLTPLSIAVISDDPEKVGRLLAQGAEAGASNRDGSTPLAVAALLDRTAAAALLIEAGADLGAKSADGSTPLHTAAFFGRAETVELLVQKGADTSATNNYGQRPIDVTKTDWKTTQFIASMVHVEVDKEKVEAGRAAAVEILRQQDVKLDPAAARAEEGKRAVEALVRMLMLAPFFHHLWFLWFLCWLVAAFGVYAAVADRCGWKGLPDWLMLSPARFLWLIPLTMVPQLFMGWIIPMFGPDTSAGILPMPHVLVYYAIFFGFGVLYFDSNDDEGRVGRRWWLSLPLGLFVIFPLGMEFSLGTFGFSEEIFSSGWRRLISAFLQVAYAWVMTFGLMGLFRRLLTKESYAIRYVSDSSYFLYLVHLPLIIGAQLMVRDWPLPVMLKFLLVGGVVTGILLVVYQVAVRYTWVGRFLNGPRKRPEKMRLARARP